eukprot:1270079-Heterocapsa_arctica.AAC.1
MPFPPDMEVPHDIVDLCHSFLRIKSPTLESTFAMRLRTGWQAEEMDYMLDNRSVCRLAATAKFWKGNYKTRLASDRFENGMIDEDAAHSSFDDFVNEWMIQDFYMEDVPDMDADTTEEAQLSVVERGLLA